MQALEMPRSPLPALGRPSFPGAQDQLLHLLPAQVPGITRGQPGPCARQRSAQSAIGRTPPRKPTGSSQGSLPLAPTSVDTLVSSAWTQPAWGGGGRPGGTQSVMMLAVPAGAGGCGHQNFLQDRSELLSRDSYFMEEQTETPFLLNCLDLGTGPRALALFLSICSSFSAPQDFRPCPELGKRDLRSPFSGSRSPPKICPLLGILVSPSA